MNKKLLSLGSLTFLLFLIVLDFGICLTKEYNDPENDVIVVKDFQYSFDLDKASISDLDVINNIDYYHTSDKSGLDLVEIDITEEGNDITIRFEVKSAPEEYPYTKRNTFFVGIVISDGQEGIGAIHVKQSFFEANKYASLYVDGYSQIKDFTYSRDGDHLTFLIEEDTLPNTIKDVYAVVGEADVYDLDFDLVKFTVKNVRIDIYPNELYGAESTNYPEQKDLDDPVVSVDFSNPYILGGLAGFGILFLFGASSIIRKK